MFAVLLTLLLLALPRSDPEALRETAEPSGGSQAATPSLSSETSLSPETIRGGASEQTRAAQETRGRAERDAPGPQRGDGNHRHRLAEVAETAETGDVDATLDLESLIESGVSPSEAAWVLDRYEASERERARLTSLIAEERETLDDHWDLVDLDDALTQEIGADNYDRLLYSAGRSNRVAVSKVLPGSPGATAGLIPGDVVLLYDGTPVYKPLKLRLLANQRARRGMTVAIVYQRGGESFEAEITTGRMGLMLLGFREQPGAWSVDANW